VEKIQSTNLGNIASIQTFGKWHRKEKSMANRPMREIRDKDLTIKHCTGIVLWFKKFPDK
jgi:hypothetical protein